MTAVFGAALGSVARTRDRANSLRPLSRQRPCSIGRPGNVASNAGPTHTPPSRFTAAKSMQSVCRLWTARELGGCCQRLAARNLVGQCAVFLREHARKTRATRAHLRRDRRDPNGQPHATARTSASARACRQIRRIAAQFDAHAAPGRRQAGTAIAPAPVLPAVGFRRMPAVAEGVAERQRRLAVQRDANDADPRAPPVPAARQCVRRHPDARGQMRAAGVGQDQIVAAARDGRWRPASGCRRSPGPGPRWWRSRQRRLGRAIVRPHVR